MTQVLLEPLSFEKRFVLGWGGGAVGKDIMPQAKREESGEECSLLVLWFGSVAGGCVQYGCYTSPCSLWHRSRAADGLLLKLQGSVQPSHLSQGYFVSFICSAKRISHPPLLEEYDRKGKKRCAATVIVSINKLRGFLR